MPNWRSLSERIAATTETELVVLSVSETEATRAYLERHGLEVAFRVVDPSALELLGLNGYPSTVAFHPADRVLRAWIGVLDDPDKAAVLAWAGTPWSVPELEAD